MSQIPERQFIICLRFNFIHENRYFKAKVITGLVMLICFIVSCSINDPKKRHDWSFYHPTFHQNDEIWVADSLAWHYQYQASISKFESILPKSSGQEKQYIHSRMLYVMLKEDRVDTTLYYTIKENYHKNPDPLSYVSLLEAAYYVGDNWDEVNVDTVGFFQLPNDFYRLMVVISKFDYLYITRSDQMNFQDLDKIFEGFEPKDILYSPLIHSYFDVRSRIYIAIRDIDVTNMFSDEVLNFDNYEIKPPNEVQILMTLKLALTSLLKSKEYSYGKSLIDRVELNKINVQCSKLNQLYNFAKYVIEYRTLTKSQTSEDRCSFENFSIQFANMMQEKYKGCNMKYYDLDFFHSRVVQDVDLKIKCLERCIRTHTNNPFLSPNFGSHVYREWQEILIRKGKLDEILQEFVYQWDNIDKRNLNVETIINHPNINNIYIINGLMNIIRIDYEMKPTKQKLIQLENLSQMGLLQLQNFTKVSEKALLTVFEQVGNELLSNILFTDYELSKYNKDYLHQFVKHSKQLRNLLTVNEIKLARDKNPLSKNVFSLNNKAKLMRRNGKENSSEYRSILSQLLIAEKVLEEFNKKEKKSYFKNEIKEKLLSSNESELLFNNIFDNYYVTLINRDKITIHKVQNSANLDAMLSKLLTLVNVDSKINVAKYYDLAVLCSEKLLGPYIQNNLRRNITIYPDGVFHALPFHALVLRQKEKPKDWREMIYFNDKYNITYRLNQTSDIGDQLANSQGKIAVFCFSDEKTIIKNLKHKNRFRELPDGYEECMHIKKLFGERVELFLGERATKGNFLKAYNDPQFSYMHIAVHGRNYNEDFDHNKLYFRGKSEGTIDSLLGIEILDQSPTGKSIILTSCQSAQGQIVDHQSSYSFARYFLINGAKQVVSSLWDIDDKCSKALYNHLYIKWHKSGKIELGDVNKSNPNHRFDPYFSHSQITLSN